LIPSLSDFGSNFAKQSRQGLSFGDDRKEVGVVSPTRHDVLVQVARYARSGDLTLIHSNVESVAFAHRGQDLHGSLSHSRDFVDLSFSC
jgi:ribosomal protein L18